MARTVRDAKLQSPTARAALKASEKPYFRAIEEGLHLGYRKGKTGGKWVMRSYLGDGAYKVETIAAADDTADADGTLWLSYSQAQTLARARFAEGRRVAAGMPAHAGPYTVKACVEAYLDWLAANRKTARDARWRAEALILPSLGDLDTAQLTTKRLRDWRDALAAAPARLRTRKGAAQRFRVELDEDPAEARRKRQASVNRTLSVLKAALNHAWRDDHKIPTDGAWRALEPFEHADAARLRYLTISECKRLIAASEPDFRKLVQAALLTGCRFGELAALVVDDFNADSGTIHIRLSKTGRGRYVMLTAEGVEYFKNLVVGRAGRDVLLPKAAGGRWLKSHQFRPIVDTCARAKITPAINFHGLRHTYASLSVMNGTPLMVVARNLGHVDTRMVEKHYGHMSASFVAEAIRAGAPTFGIKSQYPAAAVGGAA